jgi:hypothetical protein
MQNHTEQCKIRGSVTCGVGASRLRVCDTVSLGEYFLMFQRNLPSTSGGSGQEELCRKRGSVIEVCVYKGQSGW